VFRDMYSVEMRSALDELDKISPERAYALELKFSFGLTNDEGAAAMGLTVHQFRAQVAFATAWLRDYFTNKPA
jgi:hypothetical protein